METCQSCKHLIAVVGADVTLYYCEVSGNVIHTPERYGRYCTDKGENDG